MKCRVVLYWVWVLTLFIPARPTYAAGPDKDRPQKLELPGAAPAYYYAPPPSFGFFWYDRFGHRHWRRR